MGTIVGQETGGRIGFLSDPMVLQLPNSRLKALIPVAILEFPGDDPDRGVAPDVIVDHTPDDYADQRDNELEIVKRLIRNDLLAASKQ